MKMKIAVIAILAVACVQSANAAWLAVTNQSGKSLAVRGASKGFKKDSRQASGDTTGYEYKLVKNGQTSSKFKSGAHEIFVSWQEFDEAKKISFGPRYMMTIPVPAATLTSTITIKSLDEAFYNFGLGAKPAVVDVFQGEKSMTFR